jgi:hypothetical protein
MEFGEKPEKFLLSTIDINLRISTLLFSSLFLIKQLVFFFLEIISKSILLLTAKLIIK